MPDSTSEEYRKLVRMVRETMEPEYILPFLSNDIYTPYFRGLPAVFFSPMRSLVNDSAEKAIRYYYEIIMNS